MPNYSQKITFYKEFSCEAKNVEEANERMQSFISDAEFSSSIDVDDYFDFEDDDIGESP